MRPFIFVVAIVSCCWLCGCAPEAPKSDTGAAAAGDQSGSSPEAAMGAQPNRGAVERPDKEGK
ncbi:MAG: hypothetical protein ACKVQS_01030 [Fimbriimonadaceae bacterium]